MPAPPLACLLLALRVRSMRRPLASNHRQRRRIRRPKLADLVAERHDDLDLLCSALAHLLCDLAQAFNNQVMIAFCAQTFSPDRLRVLSRGTTRRPD